jgi:hypothetical protein
MFVLVDFLFLMLLLFMLMFRFVVSVMTLLAFLSTLHLFGSLVVGSAIFCGIAGSWDGWSILTRRFNSSLNICALDSAIPRCYIYNATDKRFGVQLFISFLD